MSSSSNWMINACYTSQTQHTGLEPKKLRLVWNHTRNHMNSQPKNPEIHNTSKQKEVQNQESICYFNKHNSIFKAIQVFWWSLPKNASALRTLATTITYSLVTSAIPQHVTYHWWMVMGADGRNDGWIRGPKIEPLSKC